MLIITSLVGYYHFFSPSIKDLEVWMSNYQATSILSTPLHLGSNLIWSTLNTLSLTFTYFLSLSLCFVVKNFLRYFSYQGACLISSKRGIWICTLEKFSKMSLSWFCLVELTIILKKDKSYPLLEKEHSNTTFGVTINSWVDDLFLFTSLFFRYIIIMSSLGLIRLLNTLQSNGIIHLHKLGNYLRREIDDCSCFHSFHCCE